MPTSGLRQLTERERSIVDECAARHGQVRGFALPIADDSGGIGSPLIRLPLLTRLEARGTISATERAAREGFHALFQRAALDSLRAADMSRVSGGAGAGDLSPASERCRRRVSDAMTALGGAGSPAAGQSGMYAAWNGPCGNGPSPPGARTSNAAAS